MASLTLFLIQFFALFMNEVFSLSFSPYSTSLPAESDHGKPVIHTFFQRIPPYNRTTGMTDEDDDNLLAFWREAWSRAGWEPVVLTEDDARSHRDFQWFQSELGKLKLDAFSNILFTRWIAMAAVGGGWYADYDVFPLRAMPREIPHNGRMTVHDIASPTLASGNAEEWMMTLMALLEDAEANRSPRDDKLTFWSDSLAVLSVTRKHKNLPPSPQTSRRVADPYSRRDPIFSQYGCSTKAFRDRWVVHFGQEMVQGGPYVPPELRLPKHRLQLAKQWLTKWSTLCKDEIEAAEVPKIS